MLYVVERPNDHHSVKPLARDAVEFVYQSLKLNKLWLNDKQHYHNRQ